VGAVAHQIARLRHVRVREDLLRLGTEHRVATGVVAVMMRVDQRRDVCLAGPFQQLLEAQRGGVGELAVDRAAEGGFESTRIERSAR